MLDIRPVVLAGCLYLAILALVFQAVIINLIPPDASFSWADVFNSKPDPNFDGGGGERARYST